jgi:hypothetical protein
MVLVIGGLNFGTHKVSVERSFEVNQTSALYATLSGNLLYPLKRTGPVVPAHPGDDQERGQAEREILEDALCPAWPQAMLLRARCF